MTIFLSESLPQQPAFLYATYGPTATAVASASASGYSASDVLQSDENLGWKPLNAEQTSITVNLGSALLTDYFAIVGTGLAGAKADVFGSSDNVTFYQISPFELISPTGANGVAWRRYNPVQYRYLKLLISYHSSSFQIKHLLFGQLVPLPFLEDGSCFNPVQSEGQHLISHAGAFLGSVTQKVIRPFSLNFGQVDAVEQIAFENLVHHCVITPKGLFFVPDISLDTCHFGYIDKKWKYEPVVKLGMATIPKIPFTSRVI